MPETFLSEMRTPTCPTTGASGLKPTISPCKSVNYDKSSNAELDVTSPSNQHPPGRAPATWRHLAVNAISEQLKET